MTTPRPAQVAGVRLSTPEQAAHAVARQLEGIGPWSRPDDPTEVEGLQRAIQEARSWQPVLLAALAPHLGSADLAIRTRAVVVAARFSRELGAAFFVERLTRDAALYAGVAPVGHPTGQPDLRWSLLLALGQAVGPGDPDGIALLRAACREPRGGWLVGALGRVDPGWLLEHAVALVRKDALGGALLALPTTALRRELVHALSPWTAAERAEALDGPFWPALDDAAAVRAAFDLRPG